MMAGVSKGRYHEAKKSDVFQNIFQVPLDNKVKRIIIIIAA